MASRIPHTALFDFPAYEAAIKQAKQSSDEFGTSLGVTLDRLANQQKALNNTLKDYSSLLKNFSSSQNAATDALKNYNKEIDELIGSVRVAKETQAGLAGGMKVAADSAAAMQREFNKLKKEYAALSPSSQDYEKNVERIKNRMKEIVPTVNAYNDAIKNSKRAIDSANGSYYAMQKELGDLRTRLRDIPGAFDQLTGKLNKNNKEAVDLSKRIQQLDTTLKQADKSMGIFVRNVGNYQSALKGLGSGLLQTIGAIVGIQSIFEGVKFVFNTNLEFDSINAGLAAVSKTTEELAINQSFLAKTADHLGVEIIGLSTAFKNFYGAATTAGLASQQTRDIFEQITRVGARLKLSQDNLNGVFTAMGQIISKGKVQAEELRGQLGERIPGAFAVAAKSMGVTQAALNDLLKEGKVVASEFLPKFAEELDKTFGGGAERVENLQASVNRFSNNLKAIANDESGGLNTFFRRIVDFFNDALIGADKFFGKIENYFNPQGKKLKELRQLYGDVYNDAMKKDITGVRNALIEANKALEEQAERMHNFRIGGDWAAFDNQKRVVEDYMETVKALTSALNTKKAEKDAGSATPFVDPEEAKKAQEKKLKQFEDYIKKQQQLLENQTEEELKLNELKLVREQQTERQFQENKLRIIQEYVEKAIALENRLRANADPARIQGFRNKGLDAQIAFDTFENKTAPKPASVALPRELAPAIAGPQEAIDGYKQLAKQIDETYDLAIRQENAVFQIQKKNKGDRYQDEKAHLERLMELNEQAAKDIGVKDIELYKKYQENKQILDEQYLELKKRRAKEIEAAIIEFGAAAAQTVLTIISDAQQARTEERITQLEKEKDREIALAGQNAAARELVEQRYQQKIAKEKRKAAQAEKTNALFMIAINTAVAVAKAAPNPVLIALAVGLGLLQAAIVAAKPIPQFRKGTQNAPKGAAVVGEEGFEMIERRDGSRRLTKSGAHVVDLEGGEKIYTHAQTKKMLVDMLQRSQLRGDDGRQEKAIASNIRQGKLDEQAEIMASAMGSKIDQAGMERAFSRAVAGIPVQHTTIDERGVRRWTEEQNRKTEYLNKQHSI